MGVRLQIEDIVRLSLDLCQQVFRDTLAGRTRLDVAYDVADSMSKYANRLLEDADYADASNRLKMTVTAWWKAHDELMQLQPRRGRPRIH